jgi:hypothetical protein
MEVPAFLQTLPQCAQDVYHAIVQADLNGTPCDEVMHRASSELKGDPRPSLAVATLASDGDIDESKKWLRAKLWVDNTGKPIDFPTSEDTQAVLMHCSHKQQEITVPIHLTEAIVTVGDLRQALREHLTQCDYYQGGNIKMSFAARLLLDSMTLVQENIHPGCVISFNVA